MTTQPMNSTGNPVTADVASNNRYGEQIGRQYMRFFGGVPITLAMSAPNDQRKCQFLDKAARAEFLVRAPASVTAYTIHYGRWVTGQATHGAGTELDGFLEVGSVTITGATAGTLSVTPPFDTETDAVGCYLTDFTGTVDVGSTFAIWVRGLPRA